VRRGADERIAELDAAQRARLATAARDAALLYPNDPELQHAAVDAALEYLHGEIDLAVAGAQWGRARHEEKRLRARVRQLAVMAAADDLSSERRLAPAAGVDRMTLRRWSGKGAGRAQVAVSARGSGKDAR
jgi:hypothetical protein